MNPTAERDREKNKIMVEEMLEKAAEAAMEEMLDELPAAEGDITFSARHEENMQKLFESAAPKKKGVLRPKRIMVLVAALLVLGGALGTVGRNPKLMQFFMKTTETNTEIRYAEGENTGDTYVTDDVTFGYIPEGMQMVKNEKGDRGIELMFQNGDKQFLFRILKTKHIANLDTEYGSMQKIRFYNMDGYFQERDGRKTLKWYTEEYAYMLRGNLEKEEFIKIAENIQ